MCRKKAGQSCESSRGEGEDGGGTSALVPSVHVEEGAGQGSAWVRASSRTLCPRNDLSFRKMKNTHPKTDPVKSSECLSFVCWDTLSVQMSRPSQKQLLPPLCTHHSLVK